MDKKSFLLKLSSFLMAVLVLAVGPILFGGSQSARSESAPGGILGLIKAERSFARLHSVRVVATNRDTGHSWETVSNNFGFYGLPVDPGIYDLSFHHSDFLTHIEGPVAVRDNSAPSVDPVLWDLDGPGSSALIGHIFWPNQAPAAYFTVRLRTSSGELLDEVITDDLGAFSFQLNGGNLSLVLEFFNQDGNYDGAISVETLDRTTRVLSTIAGGFRNYYEDRGPWF